ncbi:MAG: NADH-quinone oxidoreductase subunit B family protein [Candidatus Hodarchaeota archaeon]
MKALTNSPWVGHLNCGSCNGCDIETLSLFIPRYDVERFGIILQGSPRHCDILLATGAVTNQYIPRLKRIYEQMPEPKFVIAIGNCASTGGVYQETYNTIDGIDKIIPVDVYIPGCPPRPEAIVEGIIKLIKKVRLDS